MCVDVVYLKDKREVIGRMYVDQKFDVSALNETKLKGKVECVYLLGVDRGRARESSSGLVNLVMRQCTVE